MMNSEGDSVLFVEYGKKVVKLIGWEIFFYNQTFLCSNMNAVYHSKSRTFTYS